MSAEQTASEYIQHHLQNLTFGHLPTGAFSKIETGVTDINLSRLEQIANIYEIDVVQLLSADMEAIEHEPSNLSIIQKKLLDREAEIANLQRKVILLYEELRNKK